MTDQPRARQPLDLDLIERRAAHLYEYTDLPDDVEILTGTEVPALVAELRRLQQQRHVLSPDEYTAAWHAINNTTGTPSDILRAVLNALDIAAWIPGPPMRLDLTPGRCATPPRVPPTPTVLSDDQWNEIADKYEAGLEPLPAPTARQPLTDQQLTPAEIRLAQYGQRTKTWTTATYDSGTEKALHQIALDLKAELDRLRAQMTETEITP